MESHPQAFTFTDEWSSGGNSTFHVVDGNGHDYAAAREYLLNAAPRLFSLN